MNLGHPGAGGVIGGCSGAGDVLGRCLLLVEEMPALMSVGIGAACVRNAISVCKRCGVQNLYVQCTAPGGKEWGMARWGLRFVGNNAVGGVRLVEGVFQ